MRRSALLVVPLLPLGLLTTSAQAAAPEDAGDPTYERVLNGTFDVEKEPWWTSASTPAGVSDGKLCAQIPAGTVNPWDSMIGQDDLPLEQDQPYTLRFDASTSRAVQFHAVLQQAAAPHATVLNKTISATTTPRDPRGKGMAIPYTAPKEQARTLFKDPRPSG